VGNRRGRLGPFDRIGGSLVDPGGRHPVQRLLQVMGVESRVY
jgi:hypothetical protein